jgi:protein-L-isoaspartate(D-aspartate) O-methyltransferase
MADFAAARRMMVDGQIRTNDVTDQRVLAAFLDTPRELFVPRAKRALSYLDLDIPVTESQDGKPARRMLKPMTLAKLIHAAAVAGPARVLDVGCGSGYSSAILGQLAATVIAIEADASLAAVAKAALADAGIRNVEVVTGPLASGHAAKAPYDVIVLEGAVEVVPQALFDQLAEGGRLACVLGIGPAAKAMIYSRNRGDISGRTVFDAAAAPLPGFAKAPAFVF